jgi:hypothetical protein
LLGFHKKNSNAFSSKYMQIITFEELITKILWWEVIFHVNPVLHHAEQLEKKL